MRTGIKVEVCPGELPSDFFLISTEVFQLAILTKDKREKVIQSLDNPSNYSPMLSRISRNHAVSISTIHSIVKKDKRENPMRIVCNRRESKVQLCDLTAFIRTITSNGGELGKVRVLSDDIFSVEHYVEARATV
jgi:hypothetical protein